MRNVCVKAVHTEIHSEGNHYLPTPILFQQAICMMTGLIFLPSVSVHLVVICLIVLSLHVIQTKLLIMCICPLIVYNSYS